MDFYKLQIKDDTNNINRVDEVLSDNRITSNLEYSGNSFNNLKKGDIVLVHKGNAAHALVKISHKIADNSKITGANFGVNYRVELLSEFKNTKKFKNREIGENKIGFSNTFSKLIDKTTRTYKFIESWYNYITKKETMQTIENLLKNKKQIILQGPPGTGKTRLAKLIAEKLTQPEEVTILDNNYIESKLSQITQVESSSNRTNYKISNVKADRCTVTLENGSNYDIPYKGIIEAYNNKLWEGGQKNGLDPYNAAIAKYLFENKALKPIEKIDAFFKQFSVDDNIRSFRQKVEDKNQEFLSKFPAETISNLPIERYALGHDDMNGFCYWLEYRLTETGKYSGTATHRKIYWSADQEKYIKSGFVKDIEDDDEAMKKVAELLHNIISEKDKKGNYEIGKGFVLKVLNTYKPNKYFPINNDVMLNNALKLFGVNGDSLNYLEKNKKLQELFIQKKKEFNTDVKNYEFMHFLFDNFNNLKGDFKLAEPLVFDGVSKIIQFHPSYTYEDFVRGITVKSIDNKIVYKTENRILAQMAKEAFENPSKNFVLIIDEINRANLSSVLGELIYALEYRYYFKKNNIKDAEVESIYDISTDGLEIDKGIILPENLYIIGTMNTADRSVGQIDYAIRRRFAFVDVLPEELNETTLKDDLKFNTEKFNEVKTLFENYITDEFNLKDVQLGHSYFIHEEGKFDLKLKYEIKPILQEYVQDGILKETALNNIENL